MRYDPEAPALLLSPHLDDAVLSAWSLIDGPEDVQVINIFAAVPEPGFVTHWDRITGGEESAEVMRRRISEDATALGSVGRTPVNLSFLDGQYRTDPPDDGFAEQIAQEIASVAGRASAIYSPAGIGGHADHTVVTRLALRLATVVPVRLYAELPYAVQFGWPARVSGLPPEQFLDQEADWDNWLGRLPLAGMQLVPEVRTLSEASCRRKVETMTLYRSQFSALNASVGGRLADLRIVDKEAWWKVVPTGPGLGWR